MASFVIHLAIANVYLKKHYIENKDDFIKGVLSVDLAPDKIKSHYTKYTDKSNLKKFLSGKVSLDNYLQENSVNSDFDKGVLIHLITDYEFYTNFLDEDKISLFDYKTFKNYIYHDYEVVNDYIKKKYEVVVPKIISKYDLSNEEKKCYLIDRKKLDEFIINMGLINLDDYIDAIISRNNKKR